MNEYTGPTSDVYSAINAIRSRVGMPDLPSNLTQDQMREKIRHERRVELAYEDFRFFDIRRWRIAEDVCNEYIQGYDVTKGKDGGFIPLLMWATVWYLRKTLPVSARYGRDSDESGT